MEVKIWLDDVRPAPDRSWIVARSVNDAKKMIWFCYLTRGEPWNARLSMVSLDHDMGDYAKDGGDGIKLLEWMAERGFLFPVHLHTLNPVGRQNMQCVIDRFWSPDANTPAPQRKSERKYRRPCAVSHT